MAFRVSKMDLTIFLAQLVSILRVVIEGNHKGKNMFFSFGALLRKISQTFLRLWHFFLPIGYPINSIFHELFDEAFFLLTIRTFTKLFRLVTCFVELSPRDMHDISTEWSLWVTWEIKYISLYLQKMYWHQTRQGANLVQEAPKHDPSMKWPTCGLMTVWKIYDVYSY